MDSAFPGLIVQPYKWGRGGGKCHCAYLALFTISLRLKVFDLLTCSLWTFALDNESKLVIYNYWDIFIFWVIVYHLKNASMYYLNLPKITMLVQWRIRYVQECKSQEISRFSNINVAVKITIDKFHWLLSRFKEC